MPMRAPGMPSRPVASVVSCWPGIVKPLMIKPHRTEPNSAPRNAPTIPPPEAVGQPDGPVPDGETDHDPHEQGHQAILRQAVVSRRAAGAFEEVVGSAATLTSRA